VVYISLGETHGECKRGRRKNKLPGHVKEKERKTKEFKRKAKNLNETDQRKERR
jgi:hypothetical protein